MKHCIKNIEHIFVTGIATLLLFQIPQCNQNLNYGMYTMFIHYPSSRIDYKELECKLVSALGETSLQFEAQNVFTNPFPINDSVIISQFTTRNYEKMIGQNVFLLMRYGISGKWISLDTLYVNDERLINSDVFIGMKMLPLGDTIRNYNAYEYNFDNTVDTLFIKSKE